MSRPLASMGPSSGVQLHPADSDMTQRLPPASYSFALPVAYSHEPKPPPQQQGARIGLPASMNPGLEEALRRDSESMAKMRDKGATDAAAVHQYLIRHASLQMKHNLQSPPLMSHAVKSTPRASTDARPSSGTSVKSATSARPCPSARTYRPHRPGQAGTSLPRTDCNGNKADITAIPATTVRLTTASSAETKVSSSLEMTSTAYSVSSGPCEHSPSRPPRPVYRNNQARGRCPVHEPIPHRRPCPVHDRTADRPPCPVHGHEPHEIGRGHTLSRATEDRVTPQQAMSAVPLKVDQPIEKQGAAMSPRRPSARVSKASATRMAVSSPSQSVKAKIFGSLDAEHQYARLQALHAAESQRSNEATTILTARNGCEAVFMPRPSLSHARQGSAGGSCLSVCCGNSTMPTTANENELSWKGLAEDHLGPQPRSMFERNRRSGRAPVVSGASASVPNLHAFDNTAIELPLPVSVSPLDLSKISIQHGAPERAIGLRGKPISESLAGLEVPRSQRNTQAALRSNSETDLMRFAIPKSTVGRREPLVLMPPSKGSIHTAGSSADSVDGPDAVEVLQAGRELEEERARWRREFQNSIEGRGRCRHPSLGMIGSNKRDRSREDVFKAGPVHPCFNFPIIFTRDTLQHDAVGSRQSSQLDSTGIVRMGSAERARSVSMQERVSMAKEVAPIQKKMSVRRKPVGVWTQKPATSDGQESGLARPLAIVPMRARSQDQTRPSGLRADFLNQAVASRRFSPQPRKSEGVRSLPTCGLSPAKTHTAFDLPTATKDVKRVSAPVGSTPPSQKLLMLRHDGPDLAVSGSRTAQASKSTTSCAASGEPKDPTLELSSRRPGATGDDSKGESLTWRDESDSMLALDAERLLLGLGSAALGRRTVEERDDQADAAFASRSDGRLARRDSMSSPPPRPVPDLPLPSLPSRLSSSLEGAAGNAGPLLMPKSVADLSRLSRQSSIGRPDSALEPPYDGPEGSLECSPPLPIPPIARHE